VTTPRRLLSNTVVAVIGGVVQRLLSFATTMLLARGLGGELFGVYAFVGAYMAIFTFLVDLGFERVITREVARQPERTGVLMGTGFILRGSLSVVAAAAAVLTAWLLRLPSLTLWCICLAALGLPLSVESFVRGFFQARFEMHYAYLLSLPGTLAFVFVAAAIMWMGGGLIAVFVAALATGALSVTLMLGIALPKMRVVWRLDGSLVRSLWRESWELGAVILIWLITLRIDQLLLYWLRGASEVGLYAVAVKITEALNLIPESIMMTVFPLLASTDLSAPQRLHRIFRVTVRYLVVLVLPMALLVTLERDILIRLLFGAAYVSGSDALAILSWWMFFSYTGAVYVSLMIVRSQQRVIGLISALALAVNVVLNLLWIPRWGATGAAAATLASSAGSFLLYCAAPQSRRMMRVCCREAARPMLAIAASVVLVGLAPAALRALLALPLYVLMLSMVGGVGRGDWALARKLLQAAPRQP
jgi:O-antigen/teichoic acid export membrane protein